MSWLAVTAQVHGADADALGDALLEAGAQSVSLDGLDGDQPRLTALLPPDTDAERLMREAAAHAALERVPEFSLERVEDEDWVRRSQAQFAPLTLGARLWIGATWHQAPEGCIAVRIDPGLAFGTGTHPSTRLALAFLEREVHGGESLLDYGCGSGILAIAAAKLGAAPVEAVDVDPQALEVTGENAALNAVAVKAVAPEGLSDTQYDIVVANILAQPLIVLAPLLCSRTRRGGRLALSGILERQGDEVARAYADAFDLQSRVEEGWALLEGERR